MRLTTAVLAAVLALGACTSSDAEVADDPPPETTTATTTEPPATTAAPLPIDLALDLAIEEYPELADVPRVALAGVVESACEALDGGVSASTLFDEAAAASVDGPLSPSSIGFLLGAGVQATCPEHAEELQRG